MSTHISSPSAKKLALAPHTSPVAPCTSLPLRLHWKVGLAPASEYVAVKFIGSLGKSDGPASADMVTLGIFTGSTVMVIALLVSVNGVAQAPTLVIRQYT